MPKQVKVPKSVSIGIGQLGLDRELMNGLVNIIHQGTPLADTLRRWPGDERCFSFQVPIKRDNEHHFFVLIVDDTTSPDHLIVQHIGYAHFSDDA